MDSLSKRKIRKISGIPEFNRIDPEFLEKMFSITITNGSWWTQTFRLWAGDFSTCRKMQFYLPRLHSAPSLGWFIGISSRSFASLSNLLVYMEEVTNYLDSRYRVDVIYLNFHKAFYKVPHQHPLIKLQAHGIVGIGYRVSGQTEKCTDKQT